MKVNEEAISPNSASSKFTTVSGSAHFSYSINTVNSMTSWMHEINMEFSLSCLLGDEKIWSQIYFMFRHHWERELTEYSDSRNHINRRIMFYLSRSKDFINTDWKGANLFLQTHGSGFSLLTTGAEDALLWCLQFKRNSCTREFDIDIYIIVFITYLKNHHVSLKLDVPGTHSLSEKQFSLNWVRRRVTHGELCSPVSLLSMDTHLDVPLT